MEFVTYNDLEQLPESADGLFSRYEKDSVFFSRLWFENLVSTALKDDQSALLACVIEGSSVLAILPVMKRLNDNWNSLSNHYTSLYTLLLADDDQQDILTCLVQGLRQLPFMAIKLEPIADNDKNIDSLQRVMESSGFRCHHTFRLFNWIHRLQGQSFEAYMAMRPSKVRNTIARKQRKLERDYPLETENGYHIRLFIDEDWQQAMTDYKEVYNKSWKGNEYFAGFADALVERLSRRGWLRLAVLYIAGQPVAAQIWFVVHGKASIFRLVYDEGWKQYSPGSILTLYLMNYVIEKDKVEEIDFLTGNEAYKQDWMSERRERSGLVCINKPEPNGRVDLIIESLKGLLRWPKS